MHEPAFGCFLLGRSLHLLHHNLYHMKLALSCFLYGVLQLPIACVIISYYMHKQKHYINVSKRCVQTYGFYKLVSSCRKSTDYVGQLLVLQPAASIITLWQLGMFLNHAKDTPLHGGNF